MTLKVLSTLAVRKALDDEIVPAFTAEHGVPVELGYDPTTRLIDRVVGGEPFDVLIMITDLLPRCAPAIDPVAAQAVARSAIGVAVPHGASKPAIATVDAFVATLLAARSVAYSRTGASGIYFAKLIIELGIADQVNRVATILDHGFAGEALADGRADLAIQQLSELLFVPGVDIIGPLPAAIQHETAFSAVVAATTAAARDAEAFVAWLRTASCAAAPRRTRLEA